MTYQTLPESLVFSNYFSPANALSAGLFCPKKSLLFSFLLDYLINRHPPLAGDPIVEESHSSPSLVIKSNLTDKVALHSLLTENVSTTLSFKLKGGENK